MPTTTEKLNHIREKCLIAIGRNQNAHFYCETCTTVTNYDRKIGLADVLLAIKKRDDQGLTPTILGDIFWEEESSVAWNLLKPLHDQEEPTINFIWELLK